MRLLAIILLFTVATPAADRRSEPRDQARSQRHTSTVKPPARSPAARAAFQRANPCPSTGRPTGSCPGYVVDHIQPLKRGGADRPDNMQWQTVAEARAKDRIE